MPQQPCLSLRLVALAVPAALLLLVGTAHSAPAIEDEIAPVMVRAPQARPRAPLKARATQRTVPSKRAPARSTARGPVAPLAQAAPVAAGGSRQGPAAPGTRGYTAAPTGLNLATPNRSGSRLDLTPLETPASIDIISGQKIRERGQNTVVEAVTQDATGITSIGSPGNGGTAFTARGFAGLNSVMNLYDGTRLYVGNGTITFPFDTWNVDRIEVLRGPASVLYGEGAIGGIINVVPKRPTFVAVNEARAALGTDGTKRLAFDSGGAISDTVAYRLNFSGNAADGWLRENGDFRNLAVSGALLWQATPDLAITVSNDYGYQEPLRYFGTPLIDGKINPAIRFNNYNVADSRIVYRDNFTQLKVDWNPTPDVTVRNIGYRLTSKRAYTDVESYAYVPRTGLVSREDYIEIFHDQEQIGNRLDATSRGHVLGMANSLLVGFDVNRIDFLRRNNSPYGGTTSVDPFVYDPGLFLNVAGTQPDYRSRTNQASVFAEDRLAVTDQLALLAGVRYEMPTVTREDLRNPANDYTKAFQAVSYRFGAVYNPLPDTALYAQYATAVDPVGSLISLTVAQKDFQLSTGEQVEVGVKQAFWGGRGEFTLAGYRIRKDKLLTVDPLRPTIAVQVGSQSAEGVEVSASLALTDTLRVEGNLALLHAQYDRFEQSVGDVAVSYRGNQPIDVPERVANVWATWAFAPRWEGRVGVQYVGTTYSDFANTAKRPDYALINAGLDYRVTDNSRLSIRGYNLTDRAYPITGSTTMWLLGRPRTVEVAYFVAF